MAGLGSLVGAGALGQSGVASGSWSSADRPRNVILLIPDGSSRVHDTAARYYRAYLEDPDRFPHNVDEIELGIDRADAFGSMSTYPDDADQFITDSAAAGTAMATGQKTSAKTVGLDPAGNRLDTILERAGAAGYATGLVTTAQLTHATPAAFATHVEKRDMREEIARQYIQDQDVDVLLGGDRSHFRADDRDDSTDLLGEAEEQGYDLVETAGELATADGRTLGLFTESGHLDYFLDREHGTSSVATADEDRDPDEIVDELVGADDDGGIFDDLGLSDLFDGGLFGDTDPDPEREEVEEVVAQDVAAETDPGVQPGVPEMTRRAIDILQDQSEQGFFLMVESARIDHLGHYNNFATIPEQYEHHDAVEVAMDYAEETASSGTAETLVVNVPDHECGGLSLGNRLNWYDMDWELIADQESAHAFNIPKAQWINAQAGVSFSTFVHTAQDVPVYAKGPGAEYFGGHLDNTDLAGGMADHLGLPSQ